MTTENKCPSYYAINIPEKNITIEVNDILKSIYRNIDIVNLKDMDCMKWNYYCNAVEYLLRALNKGLMHKSSWVTL
jgi:hypothetical protein